MVLFTNGPSAVRIGPGPLQDALRGPVHTGRGVGPGVGVGMGSGGLVVVVVVVVVVGGVGVGTGLGGGHFVALARMANIDHGAQIVRIKARFTQPP